MKTVQYPKGNRSVSNFNQVAHTLSLFVRHHAPHRPLYDHPTPTCSGRDAQANGWQFKSLVTDPCCSGSNETADTITSIKYSADTWLLMAHTEHIHMHTYAHTHTPKPFPTFAIDFPLGSGPSVQQSSHQNQLRVLLLMMYVYFEL